MKKDTPTAHNEALYGQIAKTVLMPGDPMRAKYIAENFLEDAICFNNVRGMLGYTGKYKGTEVSVMASGMGMPSMGIYSYELFKFYDVENIIRIGSCGAYSDDLNLLDIFLVERCYSEGNFALTFRNSNEHIIDASDNLNEVIKKVAKNKGLNLVIGNALTSECFDPYIDVDSLLKRVPKEFSCMVAEMEAYALFNTAKKLGKNASCLLSVVDCINKDTHLDAKDREKSLNDMIKLALDSAIKI